MKSDEPQNPKTPSKRNLNFTDFNCLIMKVSREFQKKVKANLKALEKREKQEENIKKPIDFEKLFKK